MPLRTFLIATAGGVTGALATKLILNSLQEKRPSTTALPPQPLPPTAGPAIAATLKYSPAPVDPSAILLYGFPGPISDFSHRQALISSFDRRTRNPAWVAEHITPESLLIKAGDRKSSQFVEDASVPLKFRALLKDYFRSGYDRGHQVPAADAKWSQSAMDETFYLTNMCPQVGNGFNRDYWSHFEDFCRRLTTRYKSVRIITGPLYLPKFDPDGKWRVSYEVVGNPPNVAVPTHFFKIIVAEAGDGDSGSGGDGDGKDGSVAVGAFVLPNAVISNHTPLTEFEVPIEMVERASGLEFLEKLPESKRRKLCKEVECSIIVREFLDRNSPRLKESGKK